MGADKDDQCQHQYGKVACGLTPISRKRGVGGPAQKEKNGRARLVVVGQTIQWQKTRHDHFGLDAERWLLVVETLDAAKRDSTRASEGNLILMRQP